MALRASGIISVPSTNQTVQVAAPTAGQTVSPTAGVNALVLNPAGTLATLTVNFPTSPVNGQVFGISSTQIVTLLTLASGSVVGGITSLAVGGFAQFVFSSALSSWVRIG